MNTFTATARVAPEKADFRPALLSLPFAGLLPEKVMSDDSEKLAANVVKFINSAGEYYGKAAEEGFSIEMWNNCVELGMQSPIEHLLWIAMHVVCKVNYLEINAEPWKDGKGADRAGFGLHFNPQFKLEPYRADFHACNIISGQENPVWIIECDGHEFHERTKAERQHEKKRDRFFTTRGFRILRFTGSEIFKDPCVVAVEIIKAVSGDQGIVTPKEYFIL